MDKILTADEFFKELHYGLAPYELNCIAGEKVVNDMAAYGKYLLEQLIPVRNI